VITSEELATELSYITHTLAAKCGTAIKKTKEKRLQEKGGHRTITVL
jgi:hypothetical protein